MVFLQRNRGKTSIWMLFQLVRHICHTLSNHFRDSFLRMTSFHFGRTATATFPWRFHSIKGSPNTGVVENFNPIQWCANESQWNKIWQMTSLCIFFHLFLCFFFFFFFENDFFLSDSIELWLIINLVPESIEPSMSWLETFCSSLAKKDDI